MNLSASELPDRCDVLVVGAGPAGSAAALMLAKGGLDVVMVDAQAFPRDKICGDGLIPDAFNALEKLGVLAQVNAIAQHVKHVTCIGPRGGRIDVPGRLAVLPRRQLDDLLCKAAIAAGARMFAPLRFIGTVDTVPDERRRNGNDDARAIDTREPLVIGARLKAEGGERRIFATWVVLATGAVPQGLMAANMCERRTPSAIALRGYVRNPAMVGKIVDLEVLWHPRLKPGYGWIFPCPNGVFNIGVGVAHTRAHGDTKGDDAKRSMEQIDLRKAFEAFSEVYPSARELLQGGQWIAEPKGAPLRCSLEGARFSRPGLIVTGEAAGTTYGFTGEGIGKAFETGILAAEAIVEGRTHAKDDTAVRATYEAALKALKPRFVVYEKAHAVNKHPWLVDIMAWSARRSPRRIRRMTGVLEETHTPGNMLSWRSWWRLLTERG